MMTMPIELWRLAPGMRFRVPELRETGTLIRASESLVIVRLDGAAETIEFEEHDGQTRRFVANRTRETSWAPTVQVIPLPPSGDDPMSTTKTKRTSKPAAAAKAKAKAPQASKAKAPAKKPGKKPGALKANGQLSAIDAAAKVLAETRQPMDTQALVAAMEAKGYWKSPGGKTPAATLYSALIREIAGKGDASRFKKIERGQFALA